MEPIVVTETRSDSHLTWLWALVAAALTLAAAAFILAIVAVSDGGQRGMMNGQMGQMGQMYGTGLGPMGSERQPGRDGMMEDR